MHQTSFTMPRWRLALGATAFAALIALGPDAGMAQNQRDNRPNRNDEPPAETVVPEPSAVEQAAAVEESGVSGIVGGMDLPGVAEAVLAPPVEPAPPPAEPAAPAEEAPVEQAPAESAPAEPAPAEQAPVDEAPAPAPVEPARGVAEEAAAGVAPAVAPIPAAAGGVAEEAVENAISANGGEGVSDATPGDGAAVGAAPSPFQAAGAAQAPAGADRAAATQRAGGKNDGAKPDAANQKVDAASQPAGGGGVVGLRDRLLGGGDETVAGGLAVGNGGTANASADGGIVVTGDIITGYNQGNTIGVGGGACGGSVAVDGGNVTNDTTLGIDAGGGTAIGDVTGGNANFGGNDGDDSVVTGIHQLGNGGFAGVGADGGIIVTGEVITGNNSGNSIDVAGCGGGTGGGSVAIEGGDVSNTSNINLSATGGTAIGDASGGDDNVGLSAGGEAAADEERPQRGVVGLRNRLLGIDGGDSVGGILAVGNGGTANASADGGIVVVGDIITGHNQGNTISVGEASPAGGDCSGSGSVAIEGGDVTNESNIDISANGGTAIGDASGGDDNVGLAQGAIAGILAVGNGGTANSTADGGIVVTGNIVTGFNSGNTIEVGSVGCAAPA